MNKRSGILGAFVVVLATIGCGPVMASGLSEYSASVGTVSSADNKTSLQLQVDIADNASKIFLLYQNYFQHNLSQREEAVDPLVVIQVRKEGQQMIASSVRLLQQYQATKRDQCRDRLESFKTEDFVEFRDRLESDEMLEYGRNMFALYARAYSEAVNQYLAPLCS